MTQPQPFVVSHEEIVAFLDEHVLNGAYPGGTCRCGFVASDLGEWTEHVADAYLEEFVR